MKAKGVAGCEAALEGARRHHRGTAVGRCRADREAARALLGGRRAHREGALRQGAGGGEIFGLFSIMRSRCRSSRRIACSRSIAARRRRCSISAFARARRRWSGGSGRWRSLSPIHCASATRGVRAMTARMQATAGLAHQALALASSSICASVVERRRGCGRARLCREPRDLLLRRARRRAGEMGLDPA